MIEARQEPTCALNYDAKGRLVDGLLDLGFRAGQISAVLKPIREKNFLGQKITLEDRKPVAALACSLSDGLSPWVGHKPHDETEFLYDKLIENQLYGREREGLCNVGAAALMDERVFRELVGALHEVEEMLMEPCGVSHGEAILECVTGGECRSLESWRQARENVVQTHHKARMDPGTLRLAEEIIEEAGGYAPYAIR